jgi:hypothetical protein
MFCVFTSQIWSLCLRPPLGGTFTTVPSNILIKLVVLLLQTSRVLIGYRLRAILSISSINTIPLSALATS